MVFKWDALAERNLLLHVISLMDGPNTSIWEGVAAKLGGGLNGNACRYYSLFASRVLSLIIHLVALLC